MYLAYTQTVLSRKLDIIIILILYEQKQNFWKMPSVTQLEISIWVWQNQWSRKKKKRN